MILSYRLVLSQIFSYLTIGFISVFVSSGVQALPVQNLFDSNAYNYIRISKKDYFSYVPTRDIFELIRVREDRTSLQLIVPKPIVENWQKKNIYFKILKYPTRFLDIYPSLKARIRKGCIPPSRMQIGYKDYRLNEIYLSCLEKKFPRILKKIKIGESVQKRNISALRIRIPAKNEHQKVERDPILFHCGIHGNELLAIEHCYDVILESILNPSSYPALEKLELWVVPILNPDGLDSYWYKTMNSGRVNSRHVDLNRNFPFRWNSGIENASSGNPKSYHFRGDSPASEPEVQAILRLFEKKQFFFSMSIHCYANSILLPYSIPETKNPIPNYVKTIGERLGEGVESQREDKEFSIKKNLYPVDGTDQDSFFHYYGSFSYLFESSHLVENYVYVPFILDTLRPATWANLIHESTQVYKWKIQVVDPFNKPLQVKIESNAYQFYENEIRKTNRNGYFRQIAPNSKPITVVLRKPGYKTKKLTIQPSKTPKRHTIILNPLSDTSQ